MDFKLVRTLRTYSSERFLLQSAGADAAVLDLHYLTDGSVFGTLTITDDALASEDRMQALLEFVDESLLPMASLDEKNLSFTVVHGKVVGQFENRGS
jgi:hypothetical protein